MHITPSSHVTRPSPAAAHHHAHGTHEKTSSAENKPGCTKMRADGEPTAVAQRPPSTDPTATKATGLDIFA